MTEPIGATVRAEETAPEEERRSFNLWLFGSTPPFTMRQWRIFAIAITAGFFNQYDHALLSLALKQIQLGLNIAESNLGSMLSMIRLGYILSLFITPLADIFGRRRLLLYTIIAYTIFTGLSAVAPGEGSFIMFQILARAFAGAESTIALVILVEEVDAANRGWAVGLLAAIGATGYGLAAIAFSTIDVIPFGWRGLYAIALVPLFLLIPLRRSLPESHRFEEEDLARTERVQIWEPMVHLLRTYPRRIMLMVWVAFLASMGANSAGEFFPKFLQEAHGYKPFNVTLLFFFGGAIGIMGSIFSGRISDRFGRRPVGAFFLAAAPLLTIWFYSAPGLSLIPAWILELFCDIGAGTILATYSAEVFPTAYRSTAGSVLAVAGTTGGALGLFLESRLYLVTHSHWIAVKYLTVFWMLSPLAVIFLPETAGRELEAISTDVD
ncbi:MAG TPA: MFS transporter [Candidatus Binataceae bacterium]|nr:MFS transporter [Candidatus Binataceae bacterium]